MHICIITPSKIGGSETFIRAHIEDLPHKVIYLYGYWLDYTWEGQSIREWHKEKYGSTRARWLNILPKFLEFRLRRHFFPQPTDVEVVRDFLTFQDIDVVLAEYGAAAAFITPVCQVASIPLVAHFFGRDASKYKILEEFFELYRTMFEFASTVFTVSSAMAQALVKQGCPREKIIVNPCGPVDSFFDVVPDYASQTLIAVGRHTYKKAPYLVLDAFRLARESCPELRFCFIGDGELFEVVERLVKAWGLENYVDLVGFVDPQTERELMKDAFAFVQHSVRARDGDSEGTPVAILEAGAAGLPVISTRHAGIPEVVIEGKTGFLVEPGDSRAMAKRITQLAKDRILTENMGIAARAHIKQHYSMKRHLSVLERVLVEAVN